METKKTKVLIDAGLSGIRIKERISCIDRDANEIDAIIVSHEHTDHIKGIGVLSRQCNIPVYINENTFNKAQDKLGEVKDKRQFYTGKPFEIDDLYIEPFSISHDAADPVGFTISSDCHKIGIATDIGFATQLVKEKLKGSHLLVLEFNHDERMLEFGPYPWELKQRIKSKRGHLSNDKAGDLLEMLLHDGLKYVILAHLSEVNNHPEKAYHIANKILKKEKRNETTLLVAQQHKTSRFIELG